jgi:hypothetical protein
LRTKFEGSDETSALWLLPLALDSLWYFSRMLRRRRIQRAGPWSTYLGEPGADIFRIDRAIDIGGLCEFLSRKLKESPAVHGCA